MPKIQEFSWVFAAILIAACSNEKSSQTDSQLNMHQDTHILTQQASGYDFYFKNNNTQAELLTKDGLELTQDEVKLNLDSSETDKAISLSFKHSGPLNLFSRANSALDLSDYYHSGVLALDIKFSAIDKMTMEVGVDCQQACRTKARLRDWALSQQENNWHKLAIPLTCLAESKEAFKKIKTPFHLLARGTGQIEIRNVRYTDNQTANFECLTADKRSTTPSVLNEFWSVQWWDKRHQQKLSQAKTSDPDLILIGDSITHGWERAGKPVWQKYFSDINTLNLGFSGDRTENVIWRLEHGEVDNLTPELTVIMIGTNNTGHRFDKPEYIKNGVAKIINLLKQKTPQSKILLLAIFPRSAQPNDIQRLNNEATNQLLKNLAKQEEILFTNINHEFLDDNQVLSSEIMPDLLHPNEQGYEIWAQQLKPYIEKYVVNAD